MSVNAAAAFFVNECMMLSSDANTVWCQEGARRVHKDYTYPILLMPFRFAIAKVKKKPKAERGMPVYVYV